MIKIGNIEASNIMIGEEQALKIFVGNTLVWLNYTEIAYLESSGTQWIDTGVKVEFPIRTKMKFKFLEGTGSLSATSTCILGARYKVETNDKFVWWVNHLNKLFALNYGNLDTGYLSGTDTSSIHEYETINDSIYVDGTLIYQNPSNSVTSNRNYTIYLFGMNKDNGLVDLRNCNMRVYSLYIQNGNDVVFNAIPVRVGQTGYMYDKISGLLFGNSGSGNFILGPDIYLLSDLQEISYLESDGNQWIDTGIYINQSDFEIGYEASGMGSWGWVHQNNGNGIWITCENSSNKCCWWYGNYSMRTLGSYQEGFYTIKYSLQGIDINTYHQSYSGNFREGISNISLKFFSLYDFNIQGVSANPRFATKFKSFYIKIGGVLVADFIPVRIGQVGYMYDKISKQLFANQGTGSFTLGPDK